MIRVRGEVDVSQHSVDRGGAEGLEWIVEEVLVRRRWKRERRGAGRGRKEGEKLGEGGAVRGEVAGDPRFRI